MIFRLRDRGSGYYLGTGPEGWKMIPPRDKRFAYLIEGPDPHAKEIRRGILMVEEFFGENKANGFHLVAESVMSQA